MKRIFLVVGALLLVALGCIHWLLPGRVEASLNKVLAHEPYAVSEAAQRLHESAFVVDLHSDSLLWKRDLLRESDVGHVDLPRLRRGNVGLQVFSAVTKSPEGLNYSSNTDASDDITKLALLQMWPPRTWSSLYERAAYQLEKLYDFASDSDLVVIRSRQDLESLLQRQAAGEPDIGAVYLIEGAHPLEGELHNLDRLYEQGLRIVGLTHFFDNELGGSLHGVSGAGLSEFGKDVIRRANELNMIIDVAHASPAMVADVLDLSDAPLMLSHGGTRGSCDTERNLSDALMQRFAAQGGLIGIGYWHAAVCDASPEGIVRAIRYAIDLLGVEHVALGSDFDGTVAVPFDTSELAILTEVMLQQGFSEDEIRSVLGENAKQFLLQNLPLN
jgi:microsomal dipeptidase-like Zn-dependent dipeptidase